MAFFQLLLKANRLEKARSIYEEEKLRQIEISKGAKPHLTFNQKIRRKKLWLKKKVKGAVSKVTPCSENSWFRQKAVLIRTDGTFENYMFKSLFGFLGGMFLTYIFFMFFIFQLNFGLSSATVLCSFIGVILTLGLAFSYRVRCVTFLLLPQFFSKRGRHALMAYAFILALTGPAKNTLHNMSVLSESMICGQEQLKHAVKAVIDLIKEPFYALRDAISKVIKTVKVVVKKIKRTLITIKRLVLSLLRVITAVYQWLASIVNICNKKLGTPYDRCQRVFDGAVADCRAKLGPLFGNICNLTYIVGSICYLVKPLDFICILVSYVSDSIVGVVRKKIKKFTQHIRAMFYVKVKFSHSFHFETKQSKTAEEISASIVKEIRSRTDKFLAIFDWMTLITSFFILFMLIRVIRYRYKWLTNDRFDNHFLTDDLRTIDLVRARQNKETVLPLNHREKSKYVPLSSILLVKVERVSLAKTAIFLSLATLKLCTYMMTDYTLYWILSIIRYHGRIETKVQQPNSVGVYVSGNGYLAELYRSIIKAFTPHVEDAQIDSMPCLPDPIPPNWDRYVQIVSLIILCWFTAIFEPYGLRLRHVVMCQYYPDRAKQRAAWLYNHIIRSRGSFLKFARRQLRRQYGITDRENVERITLRERLTAICPFLNKLFPLKQRYCLLCGAVERDDRDPHIQCPTPGCVGLFCMPCFSDLQNLCTICKTPIEYGDLSDMSEEKDSSDDQEYIDTKKIQKPVSESTSEQEQLPEKKDAEETEEEATKEEEDETEQTDKRLEDSEQSSPESVYSYTYQDESAAEPPEELALQRERKPFKDVEAQKIRDDVTIQIFNDPLAKETSSSSDGPTPCFVLRAHRKLRAKLKRKSVGSPPGEDSGSSTSIADTESWPTEEVEEDEEVIHIEVDDGSNEPLLQDCGSNRKYGRIEKIVAALARIPWLGKGTGAERDGSESATRKPSLMDRIVNALRGNRSSLPVQTRKRTEAYQDDRKRKASPFASPSTSSSENDDENRSLLTPHDKSAGTEQLRKRKTDSREWKSDDNDNIYSKSYDSHRGRRRAGINYPNVYTARTENLNLRHPHEKKFATKQIPRYLEPMSSEMAYYEIDETGDSRFLHKRVRQGDDINVLSDAKTSSDSRKADTWNIIGDDDEIDPYSCTSGITYDGSGDRNDYQQGMSTIEERSDEMSESTENSDDVSEITEYSIEEYENIVSRSSRYKPRVHRRVQEMKSRTPVRKSKFSLPQKRAKVFLDKQKLLRRSPKGRKMKRTQISEPEKRTEKIDDRSTDLKPNDKNMNINRQDKVNAYEKEEAKSKLKRFKISQLYDPLAGMKIFGASHKRREKSDKSVDEKAMEVKEHLEVQKETKKAEFEKVGEDAKREESKLSRTTVKKIDKGTDLPDITRGTQTSIPKAKADINAGKLKYANRTTDTGASEKSDAEKRLIRKKMKKGRDHHERKTYQEKNYTENDSSPQKGKRYFSDVYTFSDDESRSDGTNREETQRYISEELKYMRRSKSPDDSRHRTKLQKIPTNPHQEDTSKRKNYLSDDDRRRFVPGFRRIVHPETKIPPERSYHYHQDEEYQSRHQRPFDPSQINEGPYNVDRRFREEPPRFLPIDQPPFRDPCNEYWQHLRNRNYARYLAHEETQTPPFIWPHRSDQPPSSAEDANPCMIHARNVCRDQECRRKSNYAERITESSAPRLRYPMLTKYLPMCQRSDLIEELKEHDRLKLIREREAMNERISRESETVSVPCPMYKSQEPSAASIACNPPYFSASKQVEEEKQMLSYQETEAFRDVVSEFRKRTFPVKKKMGAKETEPLISISRRADKTKEVKQLFPREDQCRRRSNISRKFTDKMARTFRVIDLRDNNN